LYELDLDLDLGLGLESHEERLTLTELKGETSKEMVDRSEVREALEDCKSRR
jgi:hypothetical protein